MLRLVHPAHEGQGTRPPKRRRAPSLSLTHDEQRHLRAAIRNTARAYGGFAVLAGVLAMSPAALFGAVSQKKRSLSAGLALAVARAAGLTVEAVISGTLSAAGRCQACGARVGTHHAAGGAS